MTPKELRKLLEYVLRKYQSDSFSATQVAKEIIKINIGERWEKEVNKLKEDYFPGSDFDLARCFIGLSFLVSDKENNAFAKGLNLIFNNLNDLKKLVEKYGNNAVLFKKNLFRNSELLKFLKNEIKLSMQIEAKILFDNCASFIKARWVPKLSRRNKRYSQTKLCVLQLAWIYHSLTR
ncbi:MAG TPA: hypothetical protein VFU62_14055, partial [Hanamia sp.]|nr:hypothetical protein [Hanamia sp.]